MVKFSSYSVSGAGIYGRKKNERKGTELKSGSGE
jgi:hypothetical protein